MAAAGKTSSTVVALSTLALAASLLLLAGSSKAACPSKNKPTPNAPMATGVSGSGGGNCPVDALKLGVCTDVLGLGNELANLMAGSWSTASSGKKPCCDLVGGLADLDAAVCLCIAIKANVLGIIDVGLPL